MTRTAMFDALRPFAPDKRFSAADIGVIDLLADRWGVPRMDGCDWLPHALALIKQFEGCELEAYPDPGSGGDPWTIGWGATGPGIKKGVRWTQAQADDRLVADVTRFAEGVDKALAGSPATGPQKGAMVSLAYNIGLGNFGASTLLKKHRAADYDGAAAQFPAWNKASNRVLPGLVRRRAAEMRVYKGLSA